MALYQIPNIQPLNPSNPVFLLNQKIDYLNSGFQQPSSIPSLTNITGGAHTYTAAELLNRYTIRSALPSNPVTDTMPTASQIVTALNNYQTNYQHSYLTRGTPINVGFYFDWTLVNNDTTDTLVVNGSTGVTFLYGSSLTVLPSSRAVVRITVTNVTSPAVSITPLSNTSSGSTVTDVSNVAALKALNVTYISDGSLIRTDGYYTYNDGGQGTYIYSSTSTDTDNGGTVIAPNSGSGRYLLQYTNSINLKQFGLVGDGVIDDTTSWDKLLAFVNTTATPGIQLIAPTGTYTISHAIQFTKSLSIIGDGRYNTIFLMTAESSSASPGPGYDTSGGPNSVDWNFLSISGIYLQGFTLRNKYTPNWSYFLVYKNAVTVSRIYSIRIRLCSDVLINDFGMENAYHIGCKIEGCYNVSITNSGYNLGLKDAFLCDVNVVGTLRESKNVQFINCDVSGQGDAGFGINSEPGGTPGVPQTSDILVDSCYVDNPSNWSGGVGATIDSEPCLNVSGAKNVKIVNNTFLNPRRNSNIIVIQSPSSVLHTMENILIEGNSFSNSIGDNDTAIGIRDATQVSLINNNFINNVGSVATGDVSNVIIDGNSFKSCLPQNIPSGSIVNGTSYRVSAGVITYNSVNIDGTSGTIASREFSGVAGQTTYSVVSGSPVVNIRTNSVFSIGGASKEVRITNNSVDTYPLPFCYSSASSTLITIDNNTEYQCQTLGDSTFGNIHSVNNTVSIVGTQNTFNNLSANSPGLYTQSGTSPTMKLGSYTESYRNNENFTRVLTSAQTTSSNTTLTDITGLSLTLKPYRTYLIEAQIQFTLADVSMGYKFSWSVPVSTNFSNRYSIIYNSSSKSIADLAVNLDWTTQVAGSLAAAARHIIIVRGTLATTTDGGTIVPRFAQNTSSAGLMTIHSGSFVNIIEGTNG